MLSVLGESISHPIIKCACGNSRKQPTTPRVAPLPGPSFLPVLSLIVPPSFCLYNIYCSSRRECECFLNKRPKIRMKTREKKPSSFIELSHDQVEVLQFPTPSVNGMTAENKGKNRNQQKLSARCLKSLVNLAILCIDC